MLWVVAAVKRLMLGLSALSARGSHSHRLLLRLLVGYPVDQGPNRGLHLTYERLSH